VPGEVGGGHAATDLLIDAGHRRIGYVNGEASMEASRHRFRGYRQALATADLPFDPDLVREGNWQPLSGYEAARDLMRLKRPPTAIFCANDLMAVGCYEALHELGLRIPDDVAVMGYDDREIAQHLHPPLTTVLLPHFEMGSIAAEMLLDAASGSTGRPRQIKVECPIVRRGSV
jgi:LacI family transcriptional regulator